ncbi:SMC-Scp complex subunit ScpB [Arthrobacter sp. 35W]|uniref:SMC-Scp complex subunit ScpB n=1 Tax=Arthrobacter sp. 35W TaxID=1132441 RepID=UPI00040577C1|nr:SMC-Scp complex subunit ScpB [Arthrobacter sp. 35W]
MNTPSEHPAADSTELDSLPGGAAAALEAVLMVVDEPVTETQLAAVVGLPVAEVASLLVELAREYDGYTGKVNGAPQTGSPALEQQTLGLPTSRPRGYELRQLAGGWRIYSRAVFAPIVSRFVIDGQTARLTQAALETLAVVAYRQPVTRARVSAIRGVNVDSVVRTLSQRGLVEDAGVDPESGATLYRTTGHFLERLGIGSVEDLPLLSPHLPGLDRLHEYDDPA